MAVPSGAGNIVAFLQYVGSFPDWQTSAALAAQYPGSTPKPDRSNSLRILLYVTGPLVLIVVPARIIVRARTTTFGWDDILIVPAFIFTLGLTICLSLLVEEGGLGKHVLFISYAALQRAQKLEFAAFVIYYTAVLFTKLSITIFLKRLFSPLTTGRKAVIYGTIAFYLLLYSFTGILYFFLCKPVAASWDLDVRLKGYYFLNVSKMVLITSIIYAIGDLWLLSLPIYTILQLSLKWQRKAGLVLVFAIGGVACAGGILKCFYVNGLYKTYDPTWNGVGFIYGCQIESVFGIISASLPALHALFVSMLPNHLRQWYTYVKSNPIFVPKKPKYEAEKEDLEISEATTNKKTDTTTFPSYWADSPRPYSQVETGRIENGNTTAGIVRVMSVSQTFSELKKGEKHDWLLPSIDSSRLHVGYSSDIRGPGASTTEDEQSDSGDSLWVLQGSKIGDDVEAGRIPRKPGRSYQG